VGAMEFSNVGLSLIIPISKPCCFDFNMFFQIQESSGLVQKLGPIEHARSPNGKDFIGTKF
jgi:hypothetical protein